MSWENPRGTGGVAVSTRHLAHSDDAKSRTDGASHLHPRARWLLPAAVGAALVIVGGGTTAAVLASHHGTEGSSAQHAAHRPASTRAKGATGLQPDGRLLGSLTLTGNGHGFSKPYLGSPGSTHDQQTTLKFTCTGDRCAQVGSPVTLSRVGPGAYRLSRRVTDSTPHGTLVYQQTTTLTVSGNRATYRDFGTGAFVGTPPHDYASHPPQGFDLIGTATFS